MGLGRLCLLYYGLVRCELCLKVEGVTIEKTDLALIIPELNRGIEWDVHVAD